jgi:catechol 2,3-dioxygenase-like lactoylglutathione lyase family enzyme
MRAAAVALLLALSVVPAAAQLEAPNSIGVTAGHVHINAADVEAQVRFWTAVGGRMVQRDKLRMVEVPGMYVLLRPQAPTGGTAGTTLNHLGLYVKDLAASVAAWKAAGLTWEPREKPVNGQGFLTGPDGVRIEIYINTAIATPIAMHHLHLMLPDPVAAQKWYAAVFGATAGQRLTFQTATVPGVEIVLGKSDAPQAPTKGRAVDHIGFEVADIEHFVARLRDAGMVNDVEIRGSPNVSGLRLFFLTDPWGTEIEVTQGLRTESR